MGLQRILLAGGPGTGKTTVINELKKDGYCCFDEVSRQVTKAAQEEGITQLFLKDPLLFSEKLLEGRIADYKKANIHTDKLYFYDRGIPEVIAYMDYRNENVPNKFHAAENHYRYDIIFYFPVWEAIYSSDNERYESLEEARAIAVYIKKKYKDLGYSLIEVPKVGPTERKDFILNSI